MRMIATEHLKVMNQPSSSMWLSQNPKRMPEVMPDAGEMLQRMIDNRRYHYQVLQPDRCGDKTKCTNADELGG